VIIALGAALLMGETGSDPSVDDVLRFLPTIFLTPERKIELRFFCASSDIVMPFAAVFEALVGESALIGRLSLDAQDVGAVD
jgi:hypothetical protein